jgi:hypothetical protein
MNCDWPTMKNVLSTRQHGILWKAYLTFGPSNYCSHGHGSFLSPQNGTCMTAAPLSFEAAADNVKSPGGSRADARNRGCEGGGEGARSATDKSLDVRMVSAFEASVGLMSRPMELKDLKGRDKEMDSIRNMLRECGELMTIEERDKWRRRLYELYKQNIEDQEAPHGGS